MTQNKKFTLLLVLLVFIPIFTAYFVTTLDENNKIRLNTSTVNQINLYIIGIAIFGCSLIALLNHKSEAPKSYWYSIPIALAIGLSFIFIAGYSISNFGF